ncbi:MAG: lamin tail domain-containing protein [Cytophagaceae bacterium]|nr:lamin tail domain-containing protein [Cytophagaceae bacterium]
MGNGGNSSAKYNQDYIILYNNGSSNVNLTGWSLQFNTASSTTTNWFKLDLGSTIQAKGFLLIAIAVNNTTGVGAIGDPLITSLLTWSYFSIRRVKS